MALLPKSIISPKNFRRREFLPVKDVAAAETRGIRSFRESGRHPAFIIPVPHGTGSRPLVTDPQTMSLHASIDPAAQRALDAQRRRSTAASIVISLLGVTLIALVLAFIALGSIIVQSPSGIVYSYPPAIPPDDFPTPRLPTSSRNPSAPSAQAMPHILGLAPSPLSLPPVEVSSIDATDLFPGSEDDFGFSDSMISGSGQWIPIHSSLRKRCTSADRLAQLEAGGGTPEIEEHVTRALRFLKQTQAPDGGWGNDHRAAMNGLSLLAYLGRCETPLSEEFGDSCLKAMIFLIDRAAKQDGRFPDPSSGRHWPYEQAIATYALAEAHTMCRAMHLNIPNLAETVQRAGQMLIDRQHASGGWDYDYEEDSSRGGDLSITAWHIQALKACKLGGIGFRNLTRSLKRSLDYVEARQAADGSFGYTGTTPAGDLPRPSLTGAGMLSLQMGGRESSRAVRKGARHALENSPFTWEGPDCDLYAHYYLAQAMFQRGGRDWDTYQPRIRDSLTARQSPDGSWPKPGGGAKVHAVGALFTNDSPTGVHYRTALATLMLEVYYRYLPATR